MLKNLELSPPLYLSSLEGFSDNGRRYFDFLIQAYGKNVAGLLYAYRNEPKEMNIAGLTTRRQI